MTSRPRRLAHAAAPLALASLVLAGCAAEAADAPTTDEAPTEEQPGDGHGHVEGAQELGEPQPRLVSVSSDGTVGVLDLLTEEAEEIGSVGAPIRAASDGRFAFVETDEGVDVVDGGAWSWDHGDHFHYYAADPALPGSIPGEGPVAVATPPLATAGGTGLFSSGSGDAVLVDMKALSEGEVSELFRLETDASAGVVAPVGDAAVVALADGSDAGLARVVDAEGSPTGVEEACEDPSGAIATRVGTVVGCADGALLAVAPGGDVTLERIPFPDDAAERPLAFDGRKNRPTVAGLSGSDGFWLLDTRAGEWTHAEVDATLVRVVAADDDDENVVALDDEGRVRVFGRDGEERAATEPLVADALAGTEASGVSLTVDTQRAYLGDPVAGVVHEIDYADGARIARELTPATSPAVSAEVGR